MQGSPTYVCWTPFYYSPDVIYGERRALVCYSRLPSIWDGNGGIVEPGRSWETVDFEAGFVLTISIYRCAVLFGEDGYWEQSDGRWWLGKYTCCETKTRRTTREWTRLGEHAESYQLKMAVAGCVRKKFRGHGEQVLRST
jgi:hypothetical protein|uniref:Uncharacterized protein n=1 Tax=Bionectria ochroleuca TaxID=29856 RepID=A0A8H7KC73_BIOOC